MKEKTYRKVLQDVIKALQQAISEEIPPHSEEVLQILDILLKPAVARYHYQPSIPVKVIRESIAGSL